MQTGKLVFGELKKHPIRTFLAVLLFSFALGAITFAIAPFFYNPTEHYLKKLEENKIQILYFQGTGAEKNNERELKKLLPEYQNVYQVSTDHYSYSGGQEKRIVKLNQLTESDAEKMGINIIKGRFPKKQYEFACSSYQFSEMQKFGINACFSATGNEETRYFGTFEEAQELFKIRHARNVWGHYELSPINFVGIVSVKYDVDYLNRLEESVKTTMDEEEVVQIQSELGYYEDSCLRNLILDYRDNSHSNSTYYVTYLPTEKTDRIALFNHLKSDLQKIRVIGYIDTIRFDLNEKDYDDHFEQMIILSQALGLFSFPISILFGLISLIMIITLETACAKSQREEIATLRALGMKSRSLFFTVFLRSMFIGLVSFAFSIGFAFLWDKFFARDGYLFMILANFDLGVVLLSSSYLNFTAFLITFIYAALVSMWASIAGYRRYRKKRPSQIFQMDRD